MSKKKSKDSAETLDRKVIDHIINLEQETLNISTFLFVPNRFLDDYLLKTKVTASNRSTPDLAVYYAKTDYLMIVETKSVSELKNSSTYAHPNNDFISNNRGYANNIIRPGDDIGAKLFIHISQLCHYSKVYNQKGKWKLQKLDALVQDFKALGGILPVLIIPRKDIYNDAMVRLASKGLIAYDNMDQFSNNNFSAYLIKQNTNFNVTRFEEVKSDKRFAVVKYSEMVK